MKLRVDDHYRIVVPRGIRPNFDDDIVYFGILPDEKRVSVMPFLYVSTVLGECERRYGEHLMTNPQTSDFFRKFTSKIDSSRIEENSRVVIPENTREVLWLVKNELLEARIVGQRMIIGQGAQ
jgi:bifunctional DNA-binding transcriptional regulator/antitoxin component of YhaV-PrlF toxin-antitoxin module